MAPPCSLSSRVCGRSSSSSSSCTAYRWRAPHHRERRPASTRAGAGAQIPVRMAPTPRAKPSHGGRTSGVGCGRSHHRHCPCRGLPHQRPEQQPRTRRIGRLLMQPRQSWQLPCCSPRLAAVAPCKPSIRSMRRGVPCGRCPCQICGLPRDQAHGMASFSSFATARAPPIAGGRAPSPQRRLRAGNAGNSIARRGSSRPLPSRPPVSALGRRGRTRSRTQPSQ